MPLRIGLVVPHIFMHRELLPQVLFSPGDLALGLANGLAAHDCTVTLFTPGPVDTTATNVTGDLSYFNSELAGRGDTYLDLLKKHPFTFITLARQVQSESISAAFAMANRDELDVVHIYTNEEDIALPFAALCKKPVVFTHHDPFNFLVKYKNVFPKYAHLNWISMSNAQRIGMPSDTTWVGNIYHGIDLNIYKPGKAKKEPYILYLGRLIEPKGVHLAINAVQRYNAAHPDAHYTLKIAGKHYSGNKDDYWQQRVLPEIDGDAIEYLGYIGDPVKKADLLSKATALIVPSVFDEPFGMVMIEALACGTPVVGLESGAIPEVISDGLTGVLAKKVIKPNRNVKTGQQTHVLDDAATAEALAAALETMTRIDPAACRHVAEERFSLDRMCRQHAEVYQRLSTK